MVGGDNVVAEPFTELVREPFRKTSRVDEHERGPMVGDVLGDAVDDVGHLLGRRHRFELALGQLERDVELALVPDVDDLWQRAFAHQQSSDRFDRPLRRRQPDARRPPVTQDLEPFEREREV